jgi:hypothetical protein
MSYFGDTLTKSDNRNHQVNIIYQNLTEIRCKAKIDRFYSSGAKETSQVI